MIKSDEGSKNEGIYRVYIYTYIAAYYIYTHTQVYKMSLEQLVGYSCFN